MSTPMFLIFDQEMNIKTKEGITNYKLKRFIPIDQIQEFNHLENQSYGQIKLKDGQIIELSANEVSMMLLFFAKNVICSNNFPKHKSFT